MTRAATAASTWDSSSLCTPESLSSFWKARRPSSESLGQRKEVSSKASLGHLGACLLNAEVAWSPMTDVQHEGNTVNRSAANGWACGRQVRK